MKNLIASFTKWLSRITERTTHSIGTDIDWNKIDATRDRLVRMRFKNAPTEEISPILHVATHNNRELGNSLTFGGVRSNDRRAMTRWFAQAEPMNVKQLEQQLRETIYKKPPTGEFFTDDDWTAKGSAYEPFGLLPGVSYEVAPKADSKRPIALIESSDSAFWGMATG